MLYTFICKRLLVFIIEVEMLSFKYYISRDKKTD